MLLAYTMLLCPDLLSELARAEVQYADLTACAWGRNGEAYTYFYDLNGSMEYKFHGSVSQGTPAAVLAENPGIDYDRYEYNLQNRLATLTKVRPGANTLEEVEYGYDTSGIRVRSEKTVTVGGTVQEHATTEYLIDPFNPTGYAQVLEETTVDELNPANRLLKNRLRFYFC